MDSILKDKVQRTAWNKVLDSGSAISLKKIFHPDYEQTAKAILQRAQNDLGYKTLNDLLVPDKVKKGDYKFVLRDFCLSEDESFDALREICSENNFYLGISYKVYCSATDGADEENTGSKKKEFFERFLGHKSIRNVLSKTFPIYIILDRIWSQSNKSISKIESFLGLEDDDDLFGSQKSKDSINVLNDLVELPTIFEDLIDDKFNPFLKFLSTAIENEEEFKTSILPEIFLINENKEKKGTDKLCAYHSSISKDDILHQEINNLIIELLPEPEPYSKPLELEEEKVLREYFSPWEREPSIPKPVIGGFISFLGDKTSKAKDYAEELLENQTVDQVRNRVDSMGSTIDGDFFKNLEIKLTLGSKLDLEATNLIGKKIRVQRSEDNEVPQEIALLRKDQKSGEWEIQFNPVPKDILNQNESVIDAIEQTLVVILKKVCGYFNYGSDDSVRELLKALADTSWVDIHLAQEFVFDEIFSYLRKKNFPHQSELTKIVTQYNEAFKDKSLAKKGKDKRIAKENEINFAEKKEELSKMLKGKLQDADSSISDDERYLLDEIRDTINKQYQYNESSIPFEIFQNADDALNQLPVDKRKNKAFVLEEENKHIKFLHWGRPVNSWAGTELSRAKARKKKYDEDLVKMLFMGGSPKNSRDNEGNTGKFGVGFKSVYLVCDRPKVVSDAIDFEIIGGFYPRPIGERFKDEILKSIPQHFKRTTIIRLDLNENFIENKNFLNDFKENAPYLPLFGLAIDEVTLKAESGNQTYKFDPFKGFGPTQKFCAGNILENSNTWKVIAHFRLGKSAKLLLEIREKKFCKINKASNIWVTVPTDERLGLGFILNAPFNLDIGRAKLHRDKARNQKIVDGFRKDFKDGLLELWKYAKKEKLESNYEFWNSLWELFGPNLVQRFRSDEDQSGLDLIEILLWGGNQATGYGWFISEKRVVPNGIESNPKLLKKGEVEYKICSKLAEHLETIKEWGHLNKILSTSVSQNVERILSRFLVQDFSPQFFGLNELVSEDPVWFNGKQANKADAERLGSLFTEQLIGKYDVVYSENNPWKETQKTLSQIRFQSKANQWKDPKELLFSSQSKEDTYTNIETLLCRFAPDEVLLCDEITTSEHAITFFKTCRDEFKCPKESTILNWCSNFSSVSTKTEFLKFLIFNSTLTDSICHRIATNDHIPDWLIKEDLFKFIFKSSILSDREKAVIIGKLFPETLNNLYTDEEDGEPEDEEDHYREQHFSNSGEYLHLILKEFRDRKDHFINLYKEKFYPGSIDPIISPDWEASKNDVSTRKEWLKIFIASLTFRFGFAWPQVTKGFIEKCEREKYLDTFAAPEADPVEWLNLLERWIEEEESSGQNHFQLFGCFPSFFKFSRYLEDYVRNIFSYLDEGNSNSKGITDLKQNTNLDGTGITSPMITKDVSLGAHFIMAEFARITGEGKGTAFYDHCYLPKKSIRKFMIQLGCQGLTEEAHSSTDSKVISDFLKEKLGTTEEDYTFDYCFHIPLLFQSDSRFTPIVQR